MVTLRPIKIEVRGINARWILRVFAFNISLIPDPPSRPPAVLQNFQGGTGDENIPDVAKMCFSRWFVQVGVHMKM